MSRLFSNFDIKMLKKEIILFAVTMTMEPRVTQQPLHGAWTLSITAISIMGLTVTLSIVIFCLKTLSIVLLSVV